MLNIERTTTLYVALLFLGGNCFWLTLLLNQTPYWPVTAAVTLTCLIVMTALDRLIEEDNQ